VIHKLKYEYYVKKIWLASFADIAKKRSKQGEKVTLRTQAMPVGSDSELRLTSQESSKIQ